ncbi:hypothetical protein QWI17_13625 [Gilvimarinus sp. SDUM040013]|uniref:Uncharacterized protein n=1 Tax=Gilvimarinus gilvus TaxID=3058038 RepID=A0ABU4S4N1_9GAMM|nr:hypothetical protein [Gilvimarinus sp. SDUM040013]MDO3386882.1 hypothetical protein [Gilvimarinus sp. SDUM040013]MDX6851462.1 hypothetical protein [Gilvimarinus sp. SDUM040013]
MDKSNLALCHRSEEIFPKKIFGPDDWAIKYTEDDARTGVIDYVIEQKNSRLASSSASLKKKGRILCFYPDLSLNDAMVAVECSLQMNPNDRMPFNERNFYIDENDTPPWDAWFHYGENNGDFALYSWVCSEMVEIIDNAIAVDAYSCLVWASELEASLNIEV